MIPAKRIRQCLKPKHIEAQSEAADRTIIARQKMVAFVLEHEDEFRTDAAAMADLEKHAERDEKGVALCEAWITALEPMAATSPSARRLLEINTRMLQALREPNSPRDILERLRPNWVKVKAETAAAGA